MCTTPSRCAACWKAPRPGWRRRGCRTRANLPALRSLQEESERVMPLDPQLYPTIDSFAHYLDLNESFHSTLVDLAKSPMLRRNRGSHLIPAFCVAQRDGVRASQTAQSQRAADRRARPSQRRFWKPLRNARGAAPKASPGNTQAWRFEIWKPFWPIRKHRATYREPRSSACRAWPETTPVRDH